MYQLGIVKTLIARHFLIGGDWGAENHLHSHQYRLELVLAASELDKHGYIIDLDILHQVVEENIAIFRDKTLNECHDFLNINPSVEHFARILCERISKDLCNKAERSIASCEVKLWENDCGFASYTM